MLESISGGLEQSSLHDRLGVLNALVAWLCPKESCEAISKPEARVLVRQLLSALCNPQYFERSWIVGLHKVIASATRSERCPTFTPMCVVNLAGGREVKESLDYVISSISLTPPVVDYCTRSLDRCFAHASAAVNLQCYV